MAIEQSVNKALNKIDFKSRQSLNCSGSGGGSSVRSNATCHNFVKKGHIHKDCSSKITGSSGKPLKKSANDIP